MTHAEAEGVCLGTPAAPVLHHEGERRAAPVEAPVLERSELVEPGEEDRPCPDHPRVRVQPGDSCDGLVQNPVAEVDEEAEQRPDAEVAGHEQHNEPAAVRAPANERVEERDERKAGRQHHRHRHQRPTGDEEEHEPAVLAAQAVRAPELLVAEEPPVGRAAPQPQAQPGQHDERRRHGDEESPVAHPRPHAVTPRSGSFPARRCGPAGRSRSRERGRPPCSGPPCPRTQASPESW